MEVELTSFDILYDFLTGVTPDGRFSCNHHKQNDAQRVQIASLIVRLSPEHFWSHVVGSPNKTTRFDDILLFHVFLPPEAQTKVDQHQVKTFLTHEDEILGLQVTVSHMVLMQVVDSLHHLRKQFSRIAFREVTLLLQPLEQLASLAITGSAKTYSSTIKKFSSSSKVS